MRGIGSLFSPGGGEEQGGDCMIQQRQRQRQRQQQLLPIRDELGRHRGGGRVRRWRRGSRVWKATPERDGVGAEGDDVVGATTRR